MQKILHTPEGVRDIYSRECEQKHALQDRLHATIRSYGYHDIETPTFEFFDVFSKEIGTTPSKELYKFLTAREIRWCCGRILRRRSHVRRQNIS